ncbi:hypothetical protein NEHOM01_1646 [Nematocida homosporus]|uniref:uncharacterized protein n=1 Tax=Nematocida homosporus TaxID=1912981 RepID=UPI002220265D|nr:uncharacterized protein NEHOM01_1646 [Nematocida homosporus]KAI5186707.1 hypothetical protein NEHOM01_1646 [Nematocida homosporus]
MTDPTIQELEEENKALREKNQELTGKLALSGNDMKGVLQTLRYTEDDGQFQVWERIAQSCPSWATSSSIDRLKTILYNPKSMYLDRLRQISNKIILLISSLLELSCEQPESEDLKWENVRAKLLDIFLDLTPERTWKWISPKLYPDLNAWCGSMLYDIATQKVTWARFIGEINKNAPHPRLVQVFNPAVEERQRFEEICYDIYLREQKVSYRNNFHRNKPKSHR